jgi:hypothetical protein
VWRSVRAGGDTKTRTSRCTLALPQRCIDALRDHRTRPTTQRRVAKERWVDHDLAFASEVGIPLDSANVRRGFRRIVTAAGLNAKDWTLRELRHSFVSLLSDEGVPIEHIARLVGHAGGSAVTETVYRKQLRPVIDEGATLAAPPDMQDFDYLFPTLQSDPQALLPESPETVANLKRLAVTMADDNQPEPAAARRLGMPGAEHRVPVVAQARAVDAGWSPPDAPVPPGPSGPATTQAPRHDLVLRTMDGRQA